MTKNTFGYWEYSRYSELSILLPVTSADAIALVYPSVNLTLLSFNGSMLFKLVRPEPTR